MSDVFGDLLAAKWRDVEFPVTRMRVDIAHDLAEHKSWGVDGARVESTGLAPVRFTFSVPLVDGITPGRSERWPGPKARGLRLYPGQMRKLINAFQQKAVGPLQHPEFGVVFCKAERMSLDWDAGRRGGVDAELAFVQTLGDQENELLGAPKETVAVGAEELDSAAFKADLKALLLAAGVDLPPYLLDKPRPLSLSELANKVKAVTDYPSLVSYRAAGQIDSLMYQANRIKESADKARSALTWPVTNNVERMKAAAHDIKQKLLEGTKDVAIFKVPADTTLAGVARQLPAARIGDIIKLNPELMRSPEILKGTVVRYYKAAA